MELHWDELEEDRKLFDSFNGGRGSLPNKLKDLKLLEDIIGDKTTLWGEVMSLVKEDGGITPADSDRYVL